MPLALSTSWNAFRHTSAKKLIFEIKETGFNDVELSFNLTQNMVKEISCLVNKRLIGVTSLHNYCPIPDNFARKAALPDCYAMSSADEDERKLAIKFTQRTIRTAASLKARAVVLHTGRVEIPDCTKQLIKLARAGKKNSLQFRRLKSSITRERKQLATKFLNNTLKSLEILNRYAEKFNIKLGVENRIYYREIPCFDELEIIFKHFTDGNIYYWHDTGHAQIMEGLGFIKHEELLKLYAKRLLGLHIHNVDRLKDHQPPTKGIIDFNFLLPYLKPQTIKVVEAHFPATKEDLIIGRELLKKIFHEK